MAKTASKAARRARRRRAWADHLFQASAPDRLAPDPIARRRGWRWRDYLVFLPLGICATVGAHVIFTAAVWGAGSLLTRIEPVPEDDTVVIEVIETPEPDPGDLAPEPEPESEPEVAAAEPEPEPAPPKPRPKPEPKPEPQPAEPPPEPPADAPPAPPRKIVGLDLGSTVAGGSGPAFATGTSLRGQTAGTATDPDLAAREPAAGDPAPERPENRKAARIPGSGIELVKPRRLSRVKPEYPPDLRAQGIEGDVVVEVRLGADGRVEEARIVKPAEYAEMNEQALVAARRERFEPARRGDRAIEYTLSYTIRFRLNE